jgi:branched-chain amino acid transport system ATP-binding protein
MNQGEVLATGTPREVQADPGVIEAYLGSVEDVSSLAAHPRPLPGGRGSKT